MAIQLINIGQIANDGTGDDLREAMIKVNQNFEELDLRDDEQTTASNLGVLGEGVFAQRLNYDLQFKKISAGTNITVTADNERIIINNPDLGLTDIRITADNGSLFLEDSDSFNVVGGDGITTEIVDDVLTITNDYVADLKEDTTPQLGGDLDAQGYNLLNVGNITASSITGNLVGNVTGNVTGLINGINPADGLYYFNNIDFGGISISVDNTIDLLVATTVIDFGTFTNPSAINIDMGAI